MSAFSNEDLRVLSSYSEEMLTDWLLYVLKYGDSGPINMHINENSPETSVDDLPTAIENSLPRHMSEQRASFRRRLNRAITNLIRTFNDTPNRIDSGHYLYRLLYLIDPVRWNVTEAYSALYEAIRTKKFLNIYLGKMDLFAESVRTLSALATYVLTNAGGHYSRNQRNYLLELYKELLDSDQHFLSGFAFMANFFPQEAKLHISEICALSHKQGRINIAGGIILRARLLGERELLDKMADTIDEQARRDSRRAGVQPPNNPTLYKQSQGECSCLEYVSHLFKDVYDVVRAEPPSSDLEWIHANIVSRRNANVRIAIARIECTDELSEITLGIVSRPKKTFPGMSCCCSQ